jgi:hypothetical protein
VTRPTLDELLDSLRTDEAGFVAGERRESEPTDADSPEVESTEAFGDDIPADPDESQAQRRRGFFLKPRTALTLLAIALALVLVGLGAYLLWFVGRPPNLSSLPAASGVQPVWQVYGPGEGDQPLFDRPMGVAVGDAGRIYVTDPGNNRVCAFDSRGRFLMSFGTFGVAKPAAGYPVTYVPGSLNYPVGIDTDDDGNVYVASLHNDSIEVFDAQGTPLRRFPDPTAPVGKGSSGSGGQGIAVTDVAVSGNRVYATDTYQIVVFNLEGGFVDQWGLPGALSESLDHPNGVAVSEDGETVYVSDSNHSRVTAFSSEGTVLWQVGEIPSTEGDRAGQEFDLPRGLEVLPDGSLLVVDAFAFELVRISPEGDIVARYGERGVDPGQLNFPNDADAFRGFLAIADRENGRLQVVRLLN